MNASCEKPFILHMQDGGQSVGKDAVVQSVCNQL